MHEGRLTQVAAQAIYGIDGNKDSDNTWNEKGIVRRVGKRDKASTAVFNSLFYVMTTSNGSVSFALTGLCDNGRTESIASARLAESFVVMGTGKMSAIDPIRLKVDLKKS